MTKSWQSRVKRTDRSQTCSQPSSQSAPQLERAILRCAANCEDEIAKVFSSLRLATSWLQAAVYAACLVCASSPRRSERLMSV